MTALRQAIEARSIAPDRLVDAGIDPDRVHALINDAEPTVDELRVLAKALRLPIRELLLGADHVDSHDIKLRTNFGRDISSELEWEGMQATTRARALGNFIGDSALPTFKDFPKTAATAEELAHIVRSNLLGLDDVAPLVEPQVIFYDRVGVVSVLSHYRSIEGASSRAGGAAVMMLASRPHSRMRFTFCHEICHLLVDLGYGDGEVWLDDTVLAPRKDYNFAEEAFANAFAAALLMPAHGVAVALKHFRAENGGPNDGLSATEIMHLARLYGTSLLVSCIRLEALELLPAGAGQTLQASISRDYGSPEKFATAIGLREDPGTDWKYAGRRLISDARTKFVSGEHSLEYISGLTGLSIGEAMEVYRADSYH